MAPPDDLLEHLRAADEEVRRAALAALTTAPDLRALPDLRFIATSDESVELRFLAKRAILVLAGLGPEGASTLRVPDLDDPAPLRRIQAAHARAARGRDEDLEALTECLATETDPTVRPVLARALGAAGTRAQIPALEPLLDDPVSDLRLAALEALSLLRDSAAYPYFVRFAREPDDRLRAFALAQLAQLGREKVIKLCEVMARAPRRWMIAAGLSVLSGLRDERHLPLFVQHLTHADAAVQERAREGVERFAAEGNAAAQDALRRLAPAPPSTPSRRIDLPDTGPQELRSPDPAARLSYIQAVLTRRDTEAIPALTSHLERESDMRVLATLVTVLGQMADPAAIDPLREYLQSPNDRVRANAVEAIGRLSPATGRGLLMKSLDDPHNRVRTNAILALWGTGPTSIRDALVALKASSDRKSRLSAIYAIGQIGEPAAGLLNDLLDDPDREIAQKARECWRMLGLEDPSGSALHSKPPSSGATPSLPPPLPDDPAALRTRIKDLEAARDAALREIADGYLERVGKTLVAPPDIAPAMAAVTAARQKFKHNTPETRAALLEKQTALARQLLTGVWDDADIAPLRDRLEHAEAALTGARARLATATPSRRTPLLVMAALLLVALLVAISLLLNRE